MLVLKMECYWQTLLPDSKCKGRDNRIPPQWEEDCIGVCGAGVCATAFPLGFPCLREEGVVSCRGVFETFV